MDTYARPTLEQIKAAISSLLAQGQKEMTTIQVIEFWGGEFASERGVPVSRSSNAAVGRYISRLASVLGIEKCPGVLRVDGGDGKRTTTRRWKRRS